jgi:Tfp pilus assembly protein PilX
LAVVLSTVALTGCGQTEQQRLAKQDRDAKTAQRQAEQALSRAEHRSAAAGLELLDQARVRCRRARGEIGHSTPAEAQRLAVRFARGSDPRVHDRMVAVCERELAR